ncbi:MAG: hypothetical protein LDL26_00025 [Caenispirillum bisanense]|nr:hypothetical protein [Caenispirillum bisanense]MCA1971255.1 hypothetical protein [Caenispirillum sp.]
MISRRNILAGTAAATIATTLPAAASPTDDQDAALLSLYEDWKALEEAVFAAEMEVRRLSRERPADIERFPSVKIHGGVYNTLEDLDATIEGERLEVARLSRLEEPGLDGKILASMLEKDMERLIQARPLLAEKIRRKDEWEASVGFQELLERREDLGCEAGALVEGMVKIAPRTPAGYAALIDVIIATRGGTLDPEGDWGDEQVMTAVSTMEAATGFSFSAPARCIAYREVSA